jgi:copper chaperone CopZ
MQPASSKLDTRGIVIAGMTCDHCLRRVEKALRDGLGVVKVRVDRAAGKATVAFDPVLTNIAELKKLIVKSGYQVPTG